GTPRSRQRGAEHLDGGRAVVFHVVAEEDRCRPAVRELALDAVAVGEPGAEAREHVHRETRSRAGRTLPRPHRGDQVLGFGGGLSVVLLPEPNGELLVRLERARSVAVTVEERDQAPD